MYYQYAYDELGQLIREDNKDANKSYTYTYDSRGNILEKKTYAFTLGTLGTVQSTHTYGYATDSWKDRLTSYNGQTITYDAIGNPLTYNNGSAYTFTWEGRQMQSASKGNQTYSYTYNSDGLRASKTVGNTTYHYYWNSGKLIAMTYDDHYMIFTYTESGTPFSVTCYDAYLDREYECLYITNLQGDVVGIYDAAKSSMVISYTYDAWGRLVGKDGTSSDYAQLEMNNPLLYRGYQYDYETGFYYLQSRYYDPSVGRFLNADDTDYLGISDTAIGWNLFAYCENNPVNSNDKFGLFTIKRWMLATPIDFLLYTLAPTLEIAIAPIKSLSRRLGQTALRKALEKPFFSFLTTTIGVAGKIIKAIKSVVKKIPFVGGWLARKIPEATKLISMLTGASLSVTINKLLNVVIPNIDIFLSVGGMIAGVIDYLVDGRLDNALWVF